MAMPHRYSVYDAMRQVIAAIPAHPVAPENRGIAQLLESPWIPRGHMYRLAANPEANGHNRPTIVMNYRDVQAVLDQWRTGPFAKSLVSVHQEIADFAEQLFAEQEARDG